MTNLVAIAVLSVWTNTAGHVIAAEPVRLAGANVVLKDAAGEKSLPLTTFPASEQRRLRLALGAYELPRKAAEVRTILADGLARAEARTKAGRMTEAELAAKRARAVRAWEHELKKGTHGLTENEIEHWKGAL